MKNKIYYIICLIFIVTGICYLVNEFITIVNSAAKLSAYYSHTISDLAVPYSVSTFSSFYILLRTTFFVVGPIFFICYNFIFQNRIYKVNIICFILSFLVCIGVIMVGLFYTNGKYHFYHLLGTILTFTSANAIILLTGLYYNNKDSKLYKCFCVVLSFIGIICGILLLLPITLKYMPVVERFTIYPLIIFEIISGFYLMHEEYIHNRIYWIEIK